MPISSGANSWPASYWHKPAPKIPNPKLVVIDTGRSPSPPPRKPSPPPPPSPRLPPPSVETEVMHIERRSSSPPPPQRVYIPPSSSTQHITHIIERQQPPPPPLPPQQFSYINRQAPPPRQMSFVNRPPQQMNYMTKQPPPPQMNYNNQTRMVNHGYSGYREYGGYQGYGGGGGGMCGGGSGGCCPDSYFSNTASGADTGCCQGGMFGSRSYPYSAEQMYMPKGTGRGRCCACVWGLILGLLLLGLLIGLLAGLLPALKSQSAQASVVQQFSNGYWLNGVYYYKVTNPPDIFYWAMGPGIPCNPYNNNTLVSPTIGYSTESISSTIVTHIVTQGPQFTLPNCNSIVTSYILANGISVSTTTINPFLLLTSSSSALCGKVFASLFAALFVRLYLG